MEIREIIFMGATILIVFIQVFMAFLIKKDKNLNSLAVHEIHMWGIRTLVFGLGGCIVYIFLPNYSVFALIIFMLFVGFNISILKNKLR